MKEEDKINSFDILIVGTSPVMLLEAYFQSKKGKKVLVIEKENEIGGAWKVVKKFEYEMDNGPHLLYTLNKDTSRLIKFLEQTVGIKFQAFKPQPKAEKSFFFNTPELNYSHYAQLTSPVDFIKFFIKLFLYSFSFLRYKIFRKSGIVYKYPIENCKGMLASFDKEIKKKESDIITNATLEKVFVEKEKIIATINSKNLEVKEIYLSSRTNIKEIYFYSKEHKFNLKEQTLSQIFIRVEDKSSKNFSYFKFLTHKHFYIAADISSTTIPSIKENQKIIAIACNKNVSNPDSIPNEFVLDELIKFNLLDKKAKILERETDHYRTAQFEKEDVEQINKISKRFEIIYYDNLMRGFLKTFNKYYKET